MLEQIEWSRVTQKIIESSEFLHCQTCTGPFWETVSAEYTSIGPPTGFQGTKISSHLFTVILTTTWMWNKLIYSNLHLSIIYWLFLPAVAAGMYFDVTNIYIFHLNLQVVWRKCIKIAHPLMV